ncbi:MAG: SDR family NAD(P)-dependent oxidoreductase, partial [Pirellulales bacterium]
MTAPTGPALFDLTGRTALVTGASRGLGLQMAGALARAGADLVITARRVEDLAGSRATLEAHGHRVTALALDLRVEGSIRDCAAAAIGAADTIDILLNNAGCNIRKPAV